MADIAPKNSGEMLALMGPSGCGKTTLLNALASRPNPGSTTSTTPAIRINGIAPSRRAARALSRFVEQDDALIGSLTVRETLRFASRLSSSSTPVRRNKQKQREEAEATIDGLLEAFGLRWQADTIVGTPLRKGLSGGQKRRVGIASQLITGPRVLFLDEPTSGLDSAASGEVVSYLRSVAKRNNVSQSSTVWLSFTLRLGGGEGGWMDGFTTHTYILTKLLSLSLF